MPAEAATGTASASAAAISPGNPRRHGEDICREAAELAAAGHQAGGAVTHEHGVVLSTVWQQYGDDAVDADHQHRRYDQRIVPEQPDIGIVPLSGDRLIL
jgi:hypothetical protein